MSRVRCVVDDETDFLAGVILDLIEQGFELNIGSPMLPNMDQPTILVNQNVEIVFTPSFDKAKEKLSDPYIVAAFIDGHLGEQTGRNGFGLVNFVHERGIRPSLYSISSHKTLYEIALLPLLDGSKDRELAHIGKHRAGIREKILQITAQYNADISEDIGAKPAPESVEPR